MFVLTTLVDNFRFYFFLIITSAFYGCENPQELDNSIESDGHYLEIQGTAQGTTFSIIYNDPLERDLSFDIDSILNE